jgi:sirohydrochlorin cobaltochelatase
MLAGHGTVDAVGVAEFVAFTDRLRRLLTTEDVDVDGGFIELSQPTVHEAWARLTGRGHTHRAAVPMVLVGAGHAKGDIPAALEREVRREPGTSYVFGRPLGPHPALQEILATRIADVASEEGTAVLLVGRGSTDPDANAEVCKVARLLQEGRGYDFVEPAFVSLARPDVATGLARCRALGATRVVVAPYFLFDGVLPRRVADQADAFGAGHPDVDVRTAGHLGDTDALAGLVVERYR